MKHTIALCKNRDFRRLYHRGKCAVAPHVAVYTAKNRLGTNRLGITTTKKLGNAVQRNRARRLIKEAYRLLEYKIPLGRDIVIVARKKTVYANMCQVMNDLEKFLC